MNLFFCCYHHLSSYVVSRSLHLLHFSLYEYVRGTHWYIRTHTHETEIRWFGFGGTSTSPNPTRSSKQEASHVKKRVPSPPQSEVETPFVFFSLRQDLSSYLHHRKTRSLTPHLIPQLLLCGLSQSFLQKRREGEGENVDQFLSYLISSSLCIQCV